MQSMLFESSSPKGDANMPDIDISALLAALLPASREFISATPPEMNTLNPNEPAGFKPEQIIYRKVVPVGEFKCRYAFIDKPTPITSGFDFDKFVISAATGHYVQNDTM